MKYDKADFGDICCGRRFESEFPDLAKLVDDALDDVYAEHDLDFVELEFNTIEKSGNYIILDYGYSESGYEGTRGIYATITIDLETERVVDLEVLTDE